MPRGTETKNFLHYSEAKGSEPPVPDVRQALRERGLLAEAPVDASEDAGRPGTALPVQPADVALLGVSGRFYARDR